MYFKKLVGERCYLSPMDIKDVAKYTEWLNDLEVTTNLGPLYSDIFNIEREEEIMRDLSKKHNYSIIDITTDELIGSVGFLDVNNLNQTAEIGIFIGNKSFWGKGYGGEAMSLLMDYGFKALNLHNIFLVVFSFNQRGQKCYEKIGFKYIGKRREMINRGGKKYDLIYMDILYDEFYEKNKRFKG